MEEVSGPRVGGLEEEPLPEDPAAGAVFCMLVW